MKKPVSKKPQPMTVLFGMKLEAARSALQEVNPCVNVRHGWFQLHFGRNEKFGEFLLISTMSDSFLLSTKQQLAEPVRKRRKPTDWVYSVGNLSDDFWHGSTGCTFLSCDGYSIAYGQDHAHRDFLSVQMPARYLNLLCRDPDSRLTHAWSPHRAVAISDAAVMDPKVMAESTGDVELDALLASLG